MQNCRSQRKTTDNGETMIIFDETTKLNMARILATSTRIFSTPRTEQECLLLLDTIISMQFRYSDDIADLEDVIEATVDFFEMFENRLNDNEVNKSLKGCGDM